MRIDSLLKRFTQELKISGLSEAGYILIRKNGSNSSTGPIICRHYRQLLPYKLCQLLALILALSALGGCQSYSYQTLLKQNALHTEILPSEPFKHRLLKTSPFPLKTNAAPLHIYIEGDGAPWISRFIIAPDPTPKWSLMLAAMRRDTTPSVYLGRPCYYHVEDQNCAAKYWTMQRYSEDVVNSMLKAVEQLASKHENVWLIGHSGGGTLATLIGRRLSQPVNVLTIAANLDHRAWTAHHYYSPLVGSLNVAKDSTRNPNMKEMHWFGSKDKNVVPQWWTFFYCQQARVECRLNRAKHSSGWLDQWPRILNEAEMYFKTP